MRAALGEGGTLSLTATQDRHDGQELPSWTLRIEGTMEGIGFALEHRGPLLHQLLEDAIEALVSVGVDLADEIDDLGWAPDPVSPLNGRAELVATDPQDADANVLT